MGINFVEKYENMSEPELVLSANEGDHDASVALLRRYMGLIKSRASAFYSGSVEMDDLVQEGIISFFIAVKKFDFYSASFTTFARVCIDRGIISAVRNFSRKKQIPHDKLMRLDELANQLSDKGPEELLIENESANDLEDSIKSVLSRLEYKVFMLYLHDYTRAEIAKQLGISQQAVSNAFYRLKKKLENL